MVSPEESLVSLWNLIPIVRVVCSPSNETIRLSSEATNISGRTSIEPSDKTCDQVSHAGYLSLFLGVILEYGPSRGYTKSLSREFSYLG